MSELTGPNPLMAMVGGAAATFGGMAVAERVMTNGPRLTGNIGTALALGAMGGLVGSSVSNMLGGTLLTDALTVGGMAGTGALLMSSRGRAGAATGAAIMGVAALGGIAFGRIAN